MRVPISPTFLTISILLSSAFVSSSAVSSCKSPRENAVATNKVPSSSPKAPEFVQSAWFAGWHDDDPDHSFNVPDISWDKYTHMTYAFATTTSDVSELSITSQDEQVMPQLVQAAHKHNVSVSISVGGWTGSQYFSTAVATPQNRTQFVNTLANFVEKWGFDGIDFDWEYPNHQGIGCNIISDNDTPNFLALLQELRSTSRTSQLILSAATSLTPFADASGNPSTDVSGFADVLDFIEMMNYDVWGPWSSAVGPNAPLNDTCAAPANQQGSAVSGVRAWTEAGIPPHKIVLGVASYGHSFSVTPQNAIQNGKLVPYPSFSASNQPAGDAWDDQPGTDVCGNFEGAGGNFDFWGLIAGGFLTAEGKPASGIYYRFDDCSQTAYVYNPKTQVQVSFDDMRSAEAKGRYITETRLRGFSTWEAGGDSKDLLLDAILNGIDPAVQFCD
ncbi:hypothetical protein Clacol_005609 [Clathrus columnatus]|uniref:GH18 domain-containing protein n=1 Tax=Clathrus columnatus TaxID=1419009 RepID=A0AAV5ACH0_9AGAM|nr:hypothetical protein Clacol_005609 [Clathrus columnatus]